MNGIGFYHWRRWLSTTRNRRRDSQPRRLVQPSADWGFDVELLESRQMLSGNVRVVLSGDVLRIWGDRQPNRIEVSLATDDRFDVRGVDTTINSVSDDFVADAPVNQILVSLYGGDDSVAVNDVSLSEKLVFHGGGGSDRLTISNLNAKEIRFHGGRGSDVLKANQVELTGSANLMLASGDNLVAVSDMTLHDDLRIVGRTGSDTIALKDITVQRLRLEVNGGRDQTLITGDISIENEAVVATGSGDDFVGLLPSRTNGTVDLAKGIYAFGGPGDDVVAANGNVNSGNRSRFMGGRGTDSIDAAGAGFIVNAFRKSFEQESAANTDSRLISLYKTLDNHGIDSTEFGSTSPSPITLSVSPQPLEFVENSPPISIDNQLTLTGPISAQVASATIEIGGFVSGQDQLSFAWTSLVAGAFDATNGVLTLSGAATLADYQAALRLVLFDNISDRPHTADRELHISVMTDQRTVNASRPIQIIEVNDSPTITFQRSSATIDSQDLPIVLDDQMQISDLDSDQLQSAVVTIAAGFIFGQDALTFAPQSGVTGTFDSSTGALTFAGAVSPETLQSVFRSVSFDNDDIIPTPGVRTIRFTVNDGESSVSSDFQLTVEDSVVAT